VDLIRSTEHVDSTAKATALVQTAKKWGSSDNLTAIVIKF